MELRTPWHELAWVDQLKAFDVPAEIFFCDKSIARWNGRAFDMDYTRMEKRSHFNDADRFIATRRRRTARDANKPGRTIRHG